MAARTLAVVRLLKWKIRGEDDIIQSLYPRAELLAKETQSYGKPSELARALYERLPDGLRRIRELRGSPPERLFWLLVTWDNLNELEQIISTKRGQEAT